MSPELSLLAGSWKEFDLALRENRGINEPALIVLKDALQKCALAWVNCDTIPRLGVSILVDIVPATESNSQLYSGELGAKVLAVAYELQELVWECVKIDEGVT